MNDLLEQKQIIDSLYQSAVNEFASPSHAWDLPIDFNEFLVNSPQGKEIFQHLKTFSSLLKAGEQRYPRLFVFDNYESYLEEKTRIELLVPVPFHLNLNQTGLSKHEPIIITVFEKVVVIDSLFEAVGRLDDILRNIDKRGGGGE